jgi:hypothetical protein
MTPTHPDPIVLEAIQRHEEAPPRDLPPKLTLVARDFHLTGRPHLWSAQGIKTEVVRRSLDLWLTEQTIDLLFRTCSQKTKSTKSLSASVGACPLRVSRCPIRALTDSISAQRRPDKHQPKMKHASWAFSFRLKRWRLIRSTPFVDKGRPPSTSLIFLIRSTPFVDKFDPTYSPLYRGRFLYFSLLRGRGVHRAETGSEK